MEAEILYLFQLSNHLQKGSGMSLLRDFQSFRQLRHCVENLRATQFKEDSSDIWLNPLEAL